MSSDIIDSVYYIDRGIVDKVTLATRLTKDNVSLSVIENGNHEPSSFGDTLATHIWELSISGLCVAVLLCKVRNRMDRLQNVEINSFHAVINNRQAYILPKRANSRLKGGVLQE
ncbi:hypothetical protein LPJ59_006459 [Coemansia sp. RSA 2399]|nr:hypothetical protein LPJ59_006459 [Coemansia sp. RSA 2399]